MKSKKLTALFTLIIGLCLICGILAACGGKTALESISLDKTTETIYAGETARLKATPSRDLYDDETLEWKSDNEKVATVKGGIVTAVAEGTAKIVAYVGDVESNECTVTVKVRTITLTAPENLTLDLLDASKNTLKLSATSSEAGDVITWVSADTSIATVDSTGLVKAAGKGEVKITAKVGATEKSVTVKVNAPEDYYKLDRNNNATVCENPDKWHWFSQGAATYTLAAEPMHANGKATLSFSNMVFTDDEAANGTKMEYYFRYMPTVAEGATTFNFSCKMTTTISGQILIGIDSEDDFPAVEYNLVSGEDNVINVTGLPVVSGKPLNIKILIHGATEENPLTISVFDYKFN